MSLTTPTVLSFDRKLENSDALMFSGNWGNKKGPEQWKKIELTVRRNRGVIGNKLPPDITDDEEAMQKEVEKPNPVWGDEATLPLNSDHDTLNSDHDTLNSDHDTLRVSFTLRVLGNLHIPSACNNPAYQERISNAVQTYAGEFNFEELAKRYATNIANGRFLWRNRVGAENIEIRVKSKSLENDLLFNAYDYSINDFLKLDKKIEALAAIIQQGLGGQGFAFVEIDAYVKLGSGQRVWPSQEMVMNIPKGEKSRHLFHLAGCAAMHSQKIGNALRTIDTWYGDGDDLTPIAIEPYGSVTHRGQAERRHPHNNFYSLRDRWFLRDETLTEKEQHFVIAILVRGGVFSEKGE